MCVYIYIYIYIYIRGQAAPNVHTHTNTATRAPEALLQPRVFCQEPPLSNAPKGNGIGAKGS